MKNKIYLLVAISLLLTACHGANPPIASPTLIPTASITPSATPQPATPSPAATASPTMALQLTPEPVDLSAPLVMQLSSRACQHPIQATATFINLQDFPKVVIAGGQVQSGGFTFGIWLYCPNEQNLSDPYGGDGLYWDPVYGVQGLGLVIEWLDNTADPHGTTRRIECSEGIEPDVNPSGWYGSCDWAGGSGTGFQVPQERLAGLEGSDLPIHYIFKVRRPGETQAYGVDLSFALRRVDDGFVVVNARTSSLAPDVQSTFAPTPDLSQLQPPPAATEFPQDQIDLFVTRLLADLNTRQLPAVKDMMSETFDLQFVPLGQQAVNREAAAQVLEYGQILASQPKIEQRNPSSRFSNGGYPGHAPSFYDIETTGWGLSGKDQGWMSFIMENGQVRWGGLLLYDDSYIPLPWLETASTPAGLIYQTNHQYFRVGTDGNSTLLLKTEGHLRISPDGAWAVSGELAQNELGVVTLVDGAKSTFPLKGYLMWAVDEAAWLDPHTLLVGLAESHDNANSQGAVGHLALVDVISGKQQDLSISVDGYSQPTITPDGTILYTPLNGILMAWRNGQAQPFPLGAVKLEDKTLYTVSRPAFSPDGKTLVGLTTAWQGNESLPAFVLVNLTAHTGQMILTYHGIPTDARIPTKIDWSPDSKWVAIDSIDYDPIQNGVSLVSADGQQRIFLGSGSSNPVWLDSETVVFSYSTWGLTRLQTYNLTTQIRCWLDLPAGVWNQSNGRGLPSVSAALFPQTLP